MKKKGNLIVGILFLILFIAFIVAVKKFDVGVIGPEGTSVGFSHLNAKFSEMIGVNMLFYTITDYLGYIALGIVAVFALVGLVQLIKRRSFAEVDRVIYALGGLYAIDLGMYAFFEKVIINYRPIVLPGCTLPEASFPSSHTVLIITVMASAAIALQRYIENRGLRITLQALCLIMLAATLVGRLLCGAHWLTDIIGGILISIALLNLFVFFAGDSRGGSLESGRYKPKH